MIRKHFQTLPAATIIFIILASCAYAIPPRHNASAITEGTFNSGNYTFPDSLNITIPNQYREIPQGDQILAKVDISNFGGLKNIDVNINYAVKDDEDNTIYMREEMMFIKDFISVERVIPTSQNIKTGTHILIIRVTYGNYTGIASETFNIKPKEEKPTQPGITWKDIILAGIILMLCAITLYFIIISKRGEDKLEEIKNMLKKIRQPKPKATKPPKKSK